MIQHKSKDEIVALIKLQNHAAEMLAFIERVAEWDFFGTPSPNNSISIARKEAFALIKKVEG